MEVVKRNPWAWAMLNKAKKKQVKANLKLQSFMAPTLDADSG
jgi:hypothetical protein